MELRERRIFYDDVVCGGWLCVVCCVEWPDFLARASRSVWYSTGGTPTYVEKNDNPPGV